MLYREIVAVCSQIHTKHTNTLCGQNVVLYTKTHPYRAVNTLRLCYKNIPLNSAKGNNLAVFWVNYAKHMYKLRVQDAHFFHLDIFISLC